MDERIAKLAKAAAASLRGEEIDPLWLYDQSVLLLEQSSLCEKTNALWHTLVDASRALNDVGEYALAGEVFEMLLQQARARLYPKLEFDALEGLAESWFYIGDQNRAFRYLQTGVISPCIDRFTLWEIVASIRTPSNWHRSCPTARPGIDCGAL